MNVKQHHVAEHCSACKFPFEQQSLAAMDHDKIVWIQTCMGALDAV